MVTKVMRTTTMGVWSEATMTLDKAQDLSHLLFRREFDKEHRFECGGNCQLYDECFGEFEWWINDELGINYLKIKLFNK